MSKNIKKPIFQDVNEDDIETQDSPQYMVQLDSAYKELIDRWKKFRAYEEDNEGFKDINYQTSFSEKRLLGSLKRYKSERQTKGQYLNWYGRFLGFPSDTKLGAVDKLIDFLEGRRPVEKFKQNEVKALFEENFIGKSNLAKHIELDLELVNEILNQVGIDSGLPNLSPTI